MNSMLTKDIELLKKENEELTEKMRKAEEGMSVFFLKIIICQAWRHALIIPALGRPRRKILSLRTIWAK
jgi:hypothetical protein